MDNFNSSLVDSIIAGNFSDTLTANLTVYVVQQGSNVEGPVTTVSVGPVLSKGTGENAREAVCIIFGLGG